MRSIGAIRPVKWGLAAVTALLVPCLMLFGAIPGEAGHHGTVARAGQEPASDPLAALNDAFREAYSRCRQQVIDQSGPTILVEGDNLVLLFNGKRTEARVIPEIYNTLKVVSHVPLAVYVTLVQLCDAPLEKESLDGLRAYRERVVAAEGVLKDRNLSEPDLLRQREIIHAAIAFLGSVLNKKQITGDELRKFTRDQAPKVLANAAESARAELDCMDKQVNAWRATLPDDEWKKLHIVVMGSALPRKGNLAVQYFAKLLGEKGEGSRIVYAESLFDEKRALNLLGTNLLDTRIGTAFFDDPEFMHQDLLADAAAALLEDDAHETLTLETVWGRSIGQP